MEEIDNYKNMDLNKLLELAWKKRKDLYQKKIDFCAISNVRSGCCSENCAFCAQSAHFHTNVEEYALLDRETLIQKAMEAKAHGANRFSFVSSGRGLTDKFLEQLLPLYAEIHEKVGISLCASHGFVTYNQAKRLKEVGVHRYHHNLESGPHFFPKICTTHTYEQRLETLAAAKEAGLSTCSGGIWGLGESLDDRIEMAECIRDAEVDSVPVNILTPIKGTPLQDNKPLPREEILRSFAIYRLVLPRQAIRIAGGRQLLSKEDQLTIIEKTVDSLMIGNYLTTTGMSAESDKELLERMGYQSEMLH